MLKNQLNKRDKDFDWLKLYQTKPFIFNTIFINIFIFNLTYLNVWICKIYHEFCPIWWLAKNIVRGFQAFFWIKCSCLAKRVSTNTSIKIMCWKGIVKYSWKV